MLKGATSDSFLRRIGREGSGQPQRRAQDGPSTWVEGLVGPRSNGTLPNSAPLPFRPWFEAEDPAVAWWNWWELVVHDDPTAWLLGSLERAGVPGPEPGALDGAGTRGGALWLYGLLDRPEGHLAERGRRELERLLDLRGGPPGIGGVPADPAERRDWMRSLRDRIDARYK